MARGSDFEKMLFGILSAIEGGQAASAADREYQLKLEDRGLARRKANAEERRAKIAEFADLGSPLEQIERGMETSEAPTFRGMKAGGFDIGQEPTLGERQDVSVFDRFAAKMAGRRGLGDARQAEAERGREFRAEEAEKSREFQREKERTRASRLPTSQVMSVRSSLIRELEAGRKGMSLTAEQEEDLTHRLADVDALLDGRGVPGFKRSRQEPSSTAPAPAKPAHPDTSDVEKVRVRLPDGRVGTIPRKNLERLKREHGAQEIN